jgi:nitrate reductase alpha subunit
VPESADWYNSSFIIAWGSNVPQTRTPDAHFFTEVRYKGTKTVAVTPDYSEVAKLADIWMHPKQGTDAAVAMAMGHVILKEFYFPDGRRASARAYFDDYVRRYTDMPMLVMLKEQHAARRRTVLVPTATCAPATCNGGARPGQQPRVEDPGLRRHRQGRAAARARSAFAGVPDGRADAGQVEPRGQGGSATPTRSSCKLSVLEDERTGARTRRRRLPLLRRPAETRTSRAIRRAASVNAARGCRR